MRRQGKWSCSLLTVEIAILPPRLPREATEHPPCLQFLVAPATTIKLVLPSTSYALLAKLELLMRSRSLHPRPRPTCRRSRREQENFPLKHIQRRQLWQRSPIPELPRVTLRSLRTRNALSWPWSHSLLSSPLSPAKSTTQSCQPSPRTTTLPMPSST